MKRTLIAVGLILILASPGVRGEQPSVSHPIGSGFAKPTRGDVALAQGRSVCRAGGIEAEGRCLLEAFRAAEAGDEEMDEVAMRLAEFAPSRPELRNDLVAKCSRDQMLRLQSVCKTRRDFGRQVFWGEAFLERFPRDEKRPAMQFDVARSRMMIELTDKNALGLWDSLAREDSEKLEGKMAALYCEAIRGPQSIAALEVAHEIAYHQSRSANNPLAAQFSDWRVIEASQRDFFRDYLEQPDIPNRDKAELLYMVLFAYHQAAQYKHVPEVAQQIFGLIGYDSELAMKAAYGIPLGLWLRKQNKEAVEQYELFLRAYPNAPDVAEASLGLARSRHELGDMAGALLQYGLTAEMYPGTSAGKEAQSVYESLLGHDVEERWIAEANRRRPDVVARLSKPISPAEAWPIRPPKSAVAKAEAPKKEKESPIVSAGPDPRFMRLAALEWKIESEWHKKQQ